VVGAKPFEEQRLNLIVKDIGLLNIQQLIGKVNLHYSHIDPYMIAKLYCLYKRVILYHNTYTIELSGYNQSSPADVISSHFMNKEEAYSLTGEIGQTPVLKGWLHSA